MIYHNLYIDRKVLSERLHNSTSILNNLYEEARIEPGYRNLIAIGYMKELMAIGAATRLTGLDGLYYLVRKELRQDNLEQILNGISSQLNTMINQNNRLRYELNEINQNGKELYRRIIEEAKVVRETQSALQSSMKTIEQNTNASCCSNSITAYNAERMRKELEYRRFFKM